MQTNCFLSDKKDLVYKVQCFIRISGTDKTDNLTCEIIYDNFTCENDRFSSGGSSVSQNKLPQLILGYIYVLIYL